MAVIHLSEKDFDETVSSGHLVLVDFWASWCGPCKMIAPILEEVDEELEGKAIIAKVNIDLEEKLAKEYGIRSIPSLFLFKDGSIVDKMVGVPRNAKEGILEFVTKNI